MQNAGALRPVEVSEIGLSAGDAATVAGFVVGSVGARAAVRLRASDLLSALSALPSAIATVVFLEGSAPSEVSVRQMVNHFDESEVDALIRHVAATQAVKRVRAGVVVESIDRSRLSTPRAPEVVDRRLLEQALRDVDGGEMVNPTELVSMNGGVVSLFEDQ